MFRRLLGQVEEDVVTAFRKGGGVPYSRYPRFLDQLASHNAASFDANLLNVTLPLVDDLETRLLQGIDVLDVGCGHGRAINLMAQAYPTSRFLGVDVAAQSIDGARAEAASRGLRNARFEVRDAATLGERESFDFITTFDAIHDQVDPASVLRGIFAALRRGGTYLCVDIGGSGDLLTDMGHPLGPFLYTARRPRSRTDSRHPGAPAPNGRAGVAGDGVGGASRRCFNNQAHLRKAGIMSRRPDSRIRRSAGSP